MSYICCFFYCRVYFTNKIQKQPYFHPTHIISLKCLVFAAKCAQYLHVKAFKFKFPGEKSRLAITCKVETQFCKLNLSNKCGALARQDRIRKLVYELDISHMMMKLNCSIPCNERLLLFYNN